MDPLKRDFSEGRFRLIYTCTFQRKIAELVQIIFGPIAAREISGTRALEKAHRYEAISQTPSVAGSRFSKNWNYNRLI